MSEQLPWANIGNEELWKNVLRPLLVSLNDPYRFQQLAPIPRNLGVLLLLYVESHQRDLAFFVVDNGAWIVSAVDEAAEFFGFDSLRSMWKKATKDMRFEEWSGKRPREVRWTAPEVIADLEQSIATGRLNRLPHELAALVRMHKEEFANLFPEASRTITA